MSKNDGGAAFPHSGYDQWAPYPGMTLRDYFAAKAMQSACLELADVPHDEALRVVPVIAKASYMIADAMLKAREVVE